MPGEFDFISWLRGRSPAASDSIQIGIGDDLAALRLPAGELVLVGIDQVLDGVHFDSAIHSPHAIGRKAMNRNLSDCAAMGCRPVAAVTSFALPRGVGEAYTRHLYLGIEEAGAAERCPVVGGDTGSWTGRLAVTVAVIGTPFGNRRPVTRGGAKPGDQIAVSGPLGGSILGRHMTFAPRLAFAHRLTQWAPVSAMIDLSDGLSRDLRHLCEASNVGAVIRAADVPIHDDTARLPDDGRTPLAHALNDGEDYELLFTAATLPRRGPDEIRDLDRVIPIGRVTAEPGLWLEFPDGRREPLEPQSWEHPL